MSKKQILAFADAAVTVEQVEALEAEAGQAGDLDQVAVCRRALAGDESAVRECERVIGLADVQQ